MGFDSFKFSIPQMMTLSIVDLRLKSNQGKENMKQNRKSWLDLSFTRHLSNID
jgi:hypothetical protein